MGGTTDNQMSNTGKKLGLLLASLTAMLTLSVSGGTSSQDFTNEYKQILEKHRGDPAKMKAALDDLLGRASRKAGLDKFFSEQDKITKQYGPFENYSDNMAEGGASYHVTDHGAWKCTGTLVGGELRLTLSLDSKRYQHEPNPSVILSRHPSSAQEKTVGQGHEPITFKVPITIIRANKEAYARLTLPLSWFNAYQIEVFQTINESLDTQSCFRIADIVATGLEDTSDSVPVTVLQEPPKAVSYCHPPKQQLPTSGPRPEARVMIYINVDGSVYRCDVIETNNPDFAEAVRIAITSWKYTPGKLNGKAVKCHIEMPVFSRK